jgi:hypothetical protein
MLMCKRCAAVPVIIGLGGNLSRPARRDSFDLAVALPLGYHNDVAESVPIAITLA